MKKAIAFAAFIVGVLFLCVVQISVVETIPQLAPLLHLPLLATVVLLYYRKMATAYTCLFIAGVLYDIYSVTPFGLFTIALSAALAVQLFLQQRVIKQQALHAIALHIVSATVTYNLLVFLATAAFDRASVLRTDIASIGTAAGNMLLMTGTHLMLLAVGAVVYFILAKRLALQFKPYGL